MPTVKLFCTTFGTVLFLYQGERVLTGTACHSWQVGVQGTRGPLRLSYQAIPCEAEREPELCDAESIAMILVRRAGRL